MSDGTACRAAGIRLKKIKALHGRLKSQRDGTGGKLTVDPPFSFRRERGTGKIYCRGGNSWRDETGRDGIFLGKILGGTGRGGGGFEAGRGGCFFFPRQDGAVGFFSRSGTGRLLFFFRGGTGRLFFFSEAGRGGCFFFPRRDGAVVLFFRGGTGRGGCVFLAPGPGGCIFCSRRDGRFFFSAGTGRFTAVVFSAGAVLFIRVPSGGDNIL